MAQQALYNKARTAAFGVVLGIMGAFSVAGMAEAATCAPGGVTLDTGGDYVDCAGPLAGNDTGGGSTFLADLNDGNIFAGYGSINLIADWSLFGKSDEDIFVEADEGAIEGDWSASGFTSNTLIVTLKSGPEFTAYLFENVTGPDIGGTFETLLAGLVNNQGRSQALSHLSIFSAEREGGDNNNEVPLPAAGWMLLAGLGGLAAARRRRKS